MAVLLPSNTTELVSYAAILLAGYLLVGGVYRLYLHPLRHIPGPKLAALTLWYEFYYDIIKSGQYTFKIGKLHEEYGPIIRISPYEVHISTPEFYDELYCGGIKKRDKWYWAAKGLAADEATISTVGHDLHRMRRSALSAFFSMKQVRALQPMIQHRVDIFLRRLERQKRSGEVIRIDYAFAAFTGDVIMEYAFGRCDDMIDIPDFNFALREAFLSAGRTNMLTMHFPWLFALLKRVQNTVLSFFLKWNPNYKSFLKLQKDVTLQVKDTIHSRRLDQEEKASLHPTIFREILDSKLPRHEMTLPRLSQEGGILVGAGTLTTTWSLAVSVFYLVSNPSALRKLREELSTAIPDPDSPPNLVVLEQLPYLHAVIQESLRLSYGIPHRLQRVSPIDPVIFTDSETKKEYSIPPGTPVGMSAYLIFQDPRIFPEPNAYKPERWIENPQLERYQIVFNKGSRICLGINLAMAELYLMLSALFRRYGSSEVRLPGDAGYLELFDTSIDDVDMAVDAMVALPKHTTKGVRVKVMA